MCVGGCGCEWQNDDDNDYLTNKNVVNFFLANKNFICQWILIVGQEIFQK